jgi:hypothetical protein
MLQLEKILVVVLMLQRLRSVFGSICHGVSRTKNNGYAGAYACREAIVLARDL